MAVIVIDGMDGTGKTTTARAIARELGLKYVHFPIKSPPEDITKWHWRDRYEFYVKDFEEWFRRNGENGGVILDRAFPSTMLYQSKDFAEANQTSTEKAMELILQDITSRVKLPEIRLIFLFEADPYVAIERVNGRGGTDGRYEKIETLKRVREAIPLCERVLKRHGYRVRRIDTTNLTIEEVIKEVMESIEQL